MTFRSPCTFGINLSGSIIFSLKHVTTEKYRHITIVRWLLFRRSNFDILQSDIGLFAHNSEQTVFTHKKVQGSIKFRDFSCSHDQDSIVR